MPRPFFLYCCLFAFGALGLVAPAQPSSPAPSSGAAAQSTGADDTAEPRFWTGTDPDAHVTVLENTPFRVMTNAPISTRDSREGASLSFTLMEDVTVDGVVIVPRGATVHGIVVQNKPAGTMTGKPRLILKLTSLDLEGRTYPLYSYQFKVEGASKSKETRTDIVGGAIVGGLAGEEYRRNNKPQSSSGRYAGTGAAVGAGAGAMASVISSGPTIDVPAEAQIDFALAAPISVVPVSRTEAKRLSRGFYPGGPVLYIRGETP